MAYTARAATRNHVLESDSPRDVARTARALAPAVATLIQPRIESHTIRCAKEWCEEVGAWKGRGVFCATNVTKVCGLHDFKCALGLSP